MQYPNWVTPNRQANLVRLFVVSKGFCVYGHPNCLIPEHHYELFIDDVIKDWVADDKARHNAEWQAEQRIMHSLGERRYPIRGQFSNISKDIFYEKQPLYYLLGLGMNGLTFKPFAKVRMSSSFMVLYVDLGDMLKDVSKTKRRKAIRYGKGLPIETERQVQKLVSLAVKHFQNH